MDKFEEAMNRSDFAFSFEGHMDDLSFEGKDKNGYYTVAQKQNDEGDFAVFFFKDYERLKQWISKWYGESYYDYLVALYDEELSKTEDYER